MAYEYDTKAVLLDLMKEGENKHCLECGLPQPQWCSLSYGCYLCLTCSGTHRSLGVHLSFVRSLTMDKWTPAQIERMKAGGNQKCREWFEAAPEYSKGMSLPDKYATHAATQYRDKLLAEAEGRSWTPADTPAPSATSTLRKPRLTTNSRGPSPGISSSDQRSNSPISGSSSPAGGAGAFSQKAANESYFSRMGAANESRSADLPPSQGGKYAGFGSQGSFNPNEATSSKALPSFDDLRDDPVSALGRGWGLFSSALGKVGQAVNESVVQPTLERAGDPNLQAQLSSYVSKAGTVLGEGARTGGQFLSTGLHSGSEVLRRDLGLDVGDMGASYVDRATGRGAGGGYGRVGQFEAPSPENNDDFFGSQLGGGSGSGGGGDYGGGGSSYGGGRASPQATSSYRDEPPAPAPQLPGDDAWAKLAPQSASRGGGSGRASPAGSSGRASPAVRGAVKTTVPVKKPAAKKDDWDDFGDKWD